MTLFRSIAKRRPTRLERILTDFEAEVAAYRQAREEMPPRPVPHPYRESRLGPDTMPRLAFGPGPVDQEWDPCGRPHPPLKTGSDEKGSTA